MRYILILLALLTTNTQAQNYNQGAPYVELFYHVNGSYQSSVDMRRCDTASIVHQYQTHLPVVVESVDPLILSFEFKIGGNPCQKIYVNIDTPGYYYECWLNNPFEIFYYDKAQWNDADNGAGQGFFLNTDEPTGSNQLADRHDFAFSLTGGGTSIITITCRLRGNVAWLLMDPAFASSSSGGGGGVDDDDWDYWFDIESGLHHQTFAGIDRWLGNETLPGEMMTVLETIEEIRDLVSAGTGGSSYTIDFDLDELDMPEWDEDFQFNTKADEIRDWFPDLSVPEEFTDATEAPELEFELPLDDWFGNLEAEYGISGPAMQNMTFTINTDAFDEIRTPLHALVFILLNVWAVLRVFNELKRH